MFALLCVGSANATVIGSLTSASLGFVIGRNFIGQTFTAPSPDNVLTDWSFWVAGYQSFHGFTTDISLAIYDWNGALNCPCVPHYSTSIPWPTSTGVFSLTGLNVPLVSGNTYVAVYRTGDYSGQTIGFHGINLYSQGQLLLGLNLDQLGTDAPIWTGFDTGFAATFASPTTGAEAPEPALLPLFAMMAAIAGARVVRRRMMKTMLDC